MSEHQNAARAIVNKLVVDGLFKPLHEAHFDIVERLIVAGMQAANVSTWTDRLPDISGEYWFRSAAVKPLTVSIWRDSENDLKALIGTNELYLTDLDVFEEFEDAEWAGPIALPLERPS